MDVLRNQIIERKVIERILEHATFKEVPYQLRRTDEEAVDHAAGGGEHADIPEAKYDEGEKVPEARATESGLDPGTSVVLRIRTGPDRDPNLGLRFLW